MKDVYIDVSSTIRHTEEILQGRPDLAEAEGINQQSLHTLSKMLAWIDSLTSQEITVPEGVWKGYDGGPLKVPIFTAISDLFEELGIEYYQFRRFKDSLFLTKWLYAYKTVNNDDDEETKEEETASVDIDAPLLKLLVVSDIATAMKDIAFQGSQIAAEIKNLKGFRPYSILWLEMMVLSIGLGRI
ncbi:hypothetical protein TWF481_012210 [Arthrobotrys musiformis]|uniref:Uncharacterized protein n=1 Tax=Arthrobotrys musiformis TaxID=47236 RepID=A0AAV9VYA9_9PEZI